MKSVSRLLFFAFVLSVFLVFSCKFESIYSGAPSWAWGNFTAYLEGSENPDDNIEFKLYGKDCELDGTEFRIFQGVEQGNPYDPASDPKDMGKEMAQKYLRIDAVSKDGLSYTFVKREITKISTLKKPITVKVIGNDLLFYKIVKSIDDDGVSERLTLYTATDFSFKTDKKTYELEKKVF